MTTAAPAEDGIVFEDPEDANGDSEPPAERTFDPKDRARDKFDELRVHAELAAVFEAVRKFDARIVPGLDPDVARDTQRTMSRLEKTLKDNNPILAGDAALDAAAVLNLPATGGLSTSDYHLHRRPGEVMIVRWLAGDEVETFYDRLQAHFDAGLNGFKDEERSAQAWKNDPATIAFLDALDAADVKLAVNYLRDPIRQHGLAVLSTQTADEINIAFLCDHVMGVPAADVVGPASAPPEQGAAEKDLAWFFKLFLLRGVVEGVERMCFFTFLQKTDDAFDF